MGITGVHKQSRISYALIQSSVRDHYSGCVFANKPPPQGKVGPGRKKTCSDDGTASNGATVTWFRWGQLQAARKARWSHEKVTTPPKCPILQAATKSNQITLGLENVIGNQKSKNNYFLKNDFEWMFKIMFARMGGNVARIAAGLRGWKKTLSKQSTTRALRYATLNRRLKKMRCRLTKGEARSAMEQNADMEAEIHQAFHNDPQVRRSIIQAPKKNIAGWTSSAGWNHPPPPPTHPKLQKIIKMSCDEEEQGWFKQRGESYWVADS